MTSKTKLTATTVAALMKAPPATGYRLVWDTELPSFGLRVTAAGAGAYILQRRINGRSHRMTICKVGVWSPERARKEALKEVGNILSGGDPVAEKARTKVESVTLREALAAYIERPGMKESTAADMQRIVNGYLKAWLSKPLTKISGDMVARMHRDIGERSHAAADLTMRYLRAVFNHAAALYTDSNGDPVLTANPVERLNKGRGGLNQWFRIGRRRTVIKAHDLPAWWAAVQQQPDNARDYMVTLVLTGMRPGEAARLRWDDVDLKGRTLTVMETKGGGDHTLPMGEFLHELLTRKQRTSSGEWVFPGRIKGEHLHAIQRQVGDVVRASGVQFCLYDLRRVFASTAEGLDLSAYTLKRLMGHATTNDVTAGYIVTDIERLREPMQRIEDFILRAAGVKKTATVVAMPKRAAKKGGVR